MATYGGLFYVLKSHSLYVLICVVVYEEFFAYQMRMKMKDEDLKLSFCLLFLVRERDVANEYEGSLVIVRNLRC